MMTSTLITLIFIIVFLFGGTIAVTLKAMNQKNFGDEMKDEPKQTDTLV